MLRHSAKVARLLGRGCKREAPTSLSVGNPLSKQHDIANQSWSAANGVVTNGGLRGAWPPVLEIGRNRPFSPFFCLFLPFPEGTKSTWKIKKTEEKGLFPQISSDFLKPPSLKPPFAALQQSAAGNVFRWLVVNRQGRLHKHVGSGACTFFRMSERGG